MLKRKILVLSIPLTFIGAAARAEEPCLARAWKALNAELYLEAIRAADKCIHDFHGDADRAEAKLQKDGVPEPPTGPVSDADKSKIFKQGLLNDVGTAYFVKGGAAEALAGKRQGRNRAYRKMATDSYRACCRYKHARTW